MCDDIEDVVCSQCKHGSWVNPCGKLACLIVSQTPIRM